MQFRRHCLYDQIRSHHLHYRQVGNRQLIQLAAAPQNLRRGSRCRWTGILPTRLRCATRNGRLEHRGANFHLLIRGTFLRPHQAGRSTSPDMFHTCPDTTPMSCRACRTGPTGLVYNCRLSLSRRMYPRIARNCFHRCTSNAPHLTCSALDLGLSGSCRVQCRNRPRSAGVLPLRFGR